VLRTPATSLLFVVLAAGCLGAPSPAADAPPLTLAGTPLPASLGPLGLFADGPAGDFALTLESIGRDEPVTVPASPPTSYACAKCPHGSRIERDVPGGVEWIAATPRGVEHGFDLDGRPPGDGPLRLEVSASAAILAHGTEALVFDGGFRYSDLHVVDALGATIPAVFAPTGSGFAIVVDDEGASYPIVIDPLLTTVLWSGEGNADNAAYGSSIAGLGDVNADGYDDFAVGAPTYTNGQAAEGRVLVYYGSASGPPSVASWSFEPDIAGQHVGSAVDGAGDVNGDGYADLIVGAEGCDQNYWGVNACASLSGRFYVFRGSASGMVTTPWANLAQASSTIRFGAAVAGAGDVNGDG
jgi:hypothetical protein